MPFYDPSSSVIHDIDNIYHIIYINLTGDCELQSDNISTNNCEETNSYSNGDSSSGKDNPSKSTKLKISNGYENYNNVNHNIVSSNSNSQFSNNGNNKNVRYWKLIHAEGHVLFPGSDHIETFAVFDRIL